MGRGRAKAKQTKVARQLKYNSGGTDLSRLASELGASTSSQPPNGEPFEVLESPDFVHRSPEAGRAADARGPPAPFPGTVEGRRIDANWC
ncbi:hypothetical protein ADL26_02875 [Thermoactinomyces vulgaris]|nr:hypothetical protein ADL26_02875 [Thermoactinomyces vulgaris]